jgi:hypothetical protein
MCMFLQGVTRLGNTGFNAYSINMDYRTGCHVDSKNVDGSLSALVILETEQGFAGGEYMLPQFRLALAPKQGNVIFHRSDHVDHGCDRACVVFLAAGSVLFVCRSFVAVRALCVVQLWDPRAPAKQHKECTRVLHSGLASGSFLCTKQRASVPLLQRRRSSVCCVCATRTTK